MFPRYLSALVLVFAFALGARAQERRAVWQIGEFDSSSDEFGTQAAGVFDVSTGLAKSWGATQQAVDRLRDDGSSRRVIRFNLSELHQGVYRLRLGLISATPRVPVVQVVVNGSMAWFYQRPERDFRE